MHKLKKQILSVDYYNEAGVDQFYNKALHILYQDLNPEMAQILNKHSNAEQLIKINSLELNLGITYETELRSQWIERFKTEFENELLRKIEQIKNGNGSPNETINKIRGDELEILMFYLKNGSLPWQAGSSNINVQVLFDRMLAKHPVEFDRKLREEHENEKLIQRIVIQFSDQQIEQLISVLQPSESLFIIQSAAEIRKTQLRDQIVKSGTQEFRNAIWQFILTYLLTDRGSYFSTREYISSLLHKISGHYNISIGLLIHEIYSSIQRVKMEPIHFQLGHLLLDIYQIEQKRKTPLLDKEFQNKQIIDFLLNESSVKKEIDESSEYYIKLLEVWMINSPLTLRQFLIKNAEPILLRKIVELIPDNEIGKLIQIINPTEAKFVVQFKDDIFKLQQEQNWINTGSNQFRADLCVILLDVILNEGNSLFSQKVFVLAALERLSIHYNLKATTLIGYVLSLIDEKQNTINSAYLFHLFLEIKKDFVSQKGIEPLSEKAKIEFYFALLTRFIPSEEKQEKNAGSASIIYKKKNEIIEYLFQKSPKTLVVWIAEHIQSEAKSVGFIRDLTLSELKKIVELLSQTKGISINGLIRLMLILDLNLTQNTQNISELELYQIAFVILSTSNQTENIERNLLATLIKKTAAKLQVSEEEFVKSVIQESDKIPGVLSNENKLFLEEKFSHVKSSQKKLADQPIGNEIEIEKEQRQIDDFSPANHAIENKKINGEFENQFMTKADAILIQEALKIDTIEDLNRWLTIQLDSIQATDLEGIKKLFKIYFGQIAEKKWQGGIITDPVITEILKRISIIEKPFLSNYFTDFDLIFTEVNSDFSVFNLNWLRSKILQFWSVERDFNQQKLTDFLLNEISIKLPKPKSELQTVLFEKAKNLKRSLKSTLILDLGSDTSEINEIHKDQEELKIKELLESKQEKKSFEKPKIDEMDTIYITNAGLVLLNPFIPVLFEKAGLVINREFQNIETQKRAVQLLQYCVSGNENMEEYLLTLPKILCGIEIDEPIGNEIQLSEEEKDLVKSLLENIIAQWSILGETSVEGLQQTFLARNGALRIKNEGWELDVEKRPFDMLIDQIPWTYTLIKYPWMNIPVYTLWR